MTLAARIEYPSPRERRATARRKLSLESTLFAAGDEVVIHDISPTGMLIETVSVFSDLKELEAEPDGPEAAQNLSFGMKLRVILSTSLLLWFLILWTARLAWSTL